MDSPPVFDWAVPVFQWGVPVFDRKVPLFDWTVPVFDWEVPGFDWKVPVFDWRHAQPAEPALRCARLEPGRAARTLPALSLGQHQQPNDLMCGDGARSGVVV